MQLTYEKWRSIMIQPALSTKDICVLRNCTEKTAQRIMRVCRSMYEGNVPANKHVITTDSYLRYFGGQKGDWLRLMGGFLSNNGSSNWKV